MTAISCTLSQARLAWSRGHGLDARSTDPIDQILARTGWVRTLGGIDAVLSLAARKQGLTRDQVDAELALDGAVKVVPAARNCIMLVPRADAPLALRLGGAGWLGRTRRDLAKLGHPEAEVHALGAAVRGVLADAGGAMSTRALAMALPEGSIHRFGDPGKKVGMSTSLPTALRFLELDGHVERAPKTGSLDTQDYVWRTPAANVFAGATVPDADDPAGLCMAMARLYFRWAGPASLEDFVSWAGVGKRDAKAAIGALGLVQVAIEGVSAPAFVHPDMVDPLRAGEPGPGSLRALPHEDDLLSHRNPLAPLVDPAHHQVSPRVWGRAGAVPLGQARGIFNRVLVLDGELVGFWAYDPARSALIGGALDGPRLAAEQIQDELGVAAGIISQFGHAKCISIDSDAKLQERADWVRSQLSEQYMSTLASSLFS